MKLYLLRHGETDWNIENKIQAPDSSRLTPKGKDQIQGWKEYFVKNQISFTSLFCSNTLRTIETLSILYPDYKSMTNVKIDERLNERFEKELVGKARSDIESLLGVPFPHRLTYELYFEGTPQSILTGSFPQNESLESLRERVSGFVQDVRKLPSESTILIIAHCLLNQYLVEYLKEGTVGENMVTEKQEHDEVIIIDLGQEKVEIKRDKLNFT